MGSGLVRDTERRTTTLVSRAARNVGGRRQSHQVSTLSGPRQVASPTRNDGKFSARLTVPGRYVFVCSIHAPGMRMTVEVRERQESAGD